MMRIRGGVICVLALLLGALFAGNARAQADYPNRPIHFIVGFAAGGGNDLFARLVVQKFQENTGITAVIDNRVGAGGRIAGAGATTRCSTTKGHTMSTTTEMPAMPHAHGGTGAALQMVTRA